MSKSDSNLELHEAMVLLLLERKHATGQGVMTAGALAKAISTRELYRQARGVFARASQIGARARQYPALFISQHVDGMSHIWLRPLPRRSQHVAKVVANKT